MFGTNKSIKLPFYHGYMFQVKVEVKGQGQMSGSKVRVKDRGQRSMSRSNVWRIAVHKLINQVLTFLGLNENEKKNMVIHKRPHSVRGLRGLRGRPFMIWWGGGKIENGLIFSA